jgi:hypothetical protein
MLRRCLCDHASGALKALPCVGMKFDLGYWLLIHRLRIKRGSSVSDNEDIGDKLKFKIIEATGGTPVHIAENQGQIYQSQIHFRWVEVGPTVEAGSKIPPIQIRSEHAIGFAALHLIVHDFEFALECFRRAYALGRPDAANIESKAFINAGVMSYARAFAQTVRGIRLSSEMFASVWNDEDNELHDFIYDLRDKHIAHSVNEFERCEPAGMIVFTPDGHVQEGISGVGVVLQTVIGLPLQRLEMAVHHVEHCINYIEARIEELRPLVHADMKADMPDEMELVPMVKFNDDPQAVRKPRGTYPKLTKILDWLKRPR